MTVDVVSFAHDRLGVKLHAGQAAALRACYDSGQPNLLLLVGRRAGKSLLAAIVAIYESVVPDFAGLLRPGETRYVLLLSVRQPAANAQLRVVRGLLRHRLRKMVVEETKESITLSNGTVIMTMPASSRAVRGWAVRRLCRIT